MVSQPKKTIHYLYCTHILAFIIIIFALLYTGIGSSRIYALTPVSKHHFSNEISDAKGPFEIKIIDMEIVDEKRKRRIPLKIYFPVKKVKSPVIIHSHGLGGSKDTKFYLAQFLSSHGYVCIHLTHFGSDSSLIDSEKTKQENLVRLKNALRNRESLSNRPLDITFLIDQLTSIEDRYPQLKAVMDKQTIGLTGHSFGAFTTLTVAGAYSKMAKMFFGTRFEDPRPLAFLAMSPQGVRKGRDPKQIFSQIHRPFLTMTGSLDLSPADKVTKGEDRLAPYLNMPPGDKYSLWIEKANHGTFGDEYTQTFADGIRINQPDPKHHRIIKIVHLAFWNAYLKGKPEAKAFLKSGSIKKISDGDAYLSYK